MEYRSNVAALLFTREGKVLICERMGQKGSWQFPQGGVDDGESTLEALHREITEEVGISPNHYEVVERKSGYVYDFPKGSSKAKKGYKGQSQTYFLCLMKVDLPKVDLGGDTGEFRDHKWIKPKRFEVAWLPDWKVPVYKAVMKDFFGAKLKK